MTCKQSVDMPSSEHSVCYCIKCKPFKIRKIKEPKSLAPKQQLKNCTQKVCLITVFSIYTNKRKTMRTTNYMVKNLTQKKIASYTSRLLEGYNSIMAYDDNILSFRFSAYGTLVLFNIMDSYYDNKPITSEDISNGIDYKFGSRNSILNLIKKAEKNKLITRTTSKLDKRQKYITPTKTLINSHEKMIEFILNFENKS